MLETAKSFGLFFAAALFEVGGAYCIWLWLRTGKTVFFVLVGLAALFVYCLIQTLQSLNFGRAFAAYAGIFLVTALCWGWFVDGKKPDTWDWIGAGICLVGVTVIVAAPRA
ncbi:MAG TPA: YnfA family protein [Aggregatilineales bacterium]|nr:YnfA family protein [Aggregatilineales bacterium]